MEIEDILKKMFLYSAMAIFALCIVSVFSSGKQESYYIEMVSSPQQGTTYCVYADINWRPNEKIYCSENFPQVLMLNAAMNAQKNILPQKETPETKKNSEFKVESF